MTESPAHADKPTFTVKSHLAALAEVAHTLAEGFYSLEPTCHITPTMLALSRRQSLVVRHLKCRGEDIDATREAAFKEGLEGGEFMAMLFLCEAWTISVDPGEAAPALPMNDPRRLEVVVFDGRDTEGNLARGRALVGREADVTKLAPLQFQPPERTSYAPSTSVVA